MNPFNFFASSLKSGTEFRLRGWMVGIGILTLCSVSRAENIRLQLSQQVRAQTKRMLIKNKVNSRQLIVTFSDDVELTERVMSYLTNDGKDKFEGAYGLVYSNDDRSSDPGFSEIDSSLWLNAHTRTKDSYYVEWLEARETKTGEKVLVALDQKGVLRDLEEDRSQEIAHKAEVRTKEDRERVAKLEAKKKALTEKATKLVEQGWVELGNKSFDKSLKTLGEAIDLKILTGESSARAFFGRGLSSFHQKGCDAMERDFKESETRPEYRDDIRYYRSLCDVDQNKLAEAKTLLTEIVASNHPQYTDAARFYLGIVADKEERYDDAEGIYSDTVDFSKDTRIVELAKQQLASLKAKEAQHRYNSKIFSVMASLGLGYDSNVIALPPSLTPADLSLKSKGSAAYQALVYLDAKNPLLYPLKQRFTYSFVNAGYLDKDIAAGNNLISHNVGAVIDWTTLSQDQHSAGLDYNLNYLGKFGSAKKYLSVTSGHWDFSRVLEEKGSLPKQFQSTLKISHFQPAQPAASAEQNQLAVSIAADSKLKYQKETQSFGPGLDLEYKKAKGQENTYFAATASGFYSKPIGPEVWHLTLNADVSVGVSSYFSSAAKRFDTTTKYSAGLARLWSSYLQSQLQFAGTSNFSNVASQYRYDRFQLNFVTTAFF